VHENLLPFTNKVTILIGRALSNTTVIRYILFTGAFIRMHWARIRDTNSTAVCATIGRIAFVARIIDANFSSITWNPSEASALWASAVVIYTNAVLTVLISVAVFIAGTRVLVIITISICVAIAWFWLTGHRTVRDKIKVAIICRIIRAHLVFWTNSVQHVSAKHRFIRGKRLADTTAIRAPIGTATIGVIDANLSFWARKIGNSSTELWSFNRLAGPTLRSF
jgi:hypothetical protein